MCQQGHAQAVAVVPALAALDPPLAFRGPTSSSLDIFAIAVALLPGGGVRSLLAVISWVGPSATGAVAGVAPVPTAAGVDAASPACTVASPVCTVVSPPPHPSPVAGFVAG